MPIAGVVVRPQVWKSPVAIEVNVTVTGGAAGGGGGPVVPFPPFPPQAARSHSAAKASRVIPQYARITRGPRLVQCTAIGLHISHPSL